MNKELILKREELRKEELNNKYIVDGLTNFLDKYSECFKKKESIDSLKRLKEYLEKQLRKKEQIEKTKIENNERLKEECRHEILLELNEYDWIICPICGEEILSEDLNFEHYLVRNTSSRIAIDLYNIILDIAKSNEDVFETFENKLLKRDKHVTIERRIKWRK